MTRLTLRSFDIFDTLLARRCVDPHRIFHAIGRKGGLPTFAEQRIAAEAALWGRGDYTYDDIYQSLINDHDLPPEDAARLKALELTEEFENFIPIRQHIVEVGPGDILISDMYLPKPFIERAVREKCGLHFNSIYLSSHGKSAGRAWEVLTARIKISEHVGDNPHSDVEMCQRFGVPGRQTDVAAMAPGETLVEELGYRRLAQAMREARLDLWSPDPAKNTLARAQIGFNFPLLFLIALIVIETARARGWRRLLFSSRDCFLLYRLVQRLTERLGFDIETAYFFTSRLARAAPSPSYVAYFDELCRDGPTAVVDICGTGWSLTRLFEAARRTDVDMFLALFIDAPDALRVYRQLGEIQRTPAAQYITRAGNNAFLEAFNSTDHRMVSDVLDADGIFIPTFVDLEGPARYGDLVRGSTEAFLRALDATDLIDTDEIRHWLSVVQPAHVEILLDAIGGQGEAIAEIWRQQDSEIPAVDILLRARLSKLQSR
jgi:hypothetical protein